MAKTNLAKYNYCQQAINQKEHIESQFWLLAEMLWKVKSDSLYKEGWTDWSEYCNEFKGLSKRSIDRIIQLYNVFVHHFGIPITELQQAGGWALLAETLPYIKTKADAEEWIEKSKVLTLQDIRKELKEKKTGIPMAQCAHPNRVKMWYCPLCGDTEQIFDTTP